MKRSEMLSKVAAAIINHNDWDLIVSRDRALEMAETILQVQEESGMLPPWRKALTWEEVGIPTHPAESEPPNFNVFLWEPEDEEK